MIESLKHILYVEDDEDIAELTMLVLTEMGKFDVVHCFSGKEAINKFPAFAPQLMLLDVMMPDMDGIETLKHIQELPGGKEVPVIFMTAKAQHNEQEAYKKMGALGVIIKPYDHTMLCNQLIAYWENYHGNR